MDRAGILRRFEAYLDSALASEEPPAGIPEEVLNGEPAGNSPPTDWYTMWAAVTALTQEVRLQGRSFKQLSDSLATAPEQGNKKESVSGLIEVRERLQRGLESTRSRTDLQPGFWDRIFAARWKAIQQSLEVTRAMEEGYRLSLAYLDDLLFQSQVRPIECQGLPFDPNRMNAIDVEETDAVPEGIVLSVYRMGYEQNGELFRPAQVRVSRKPGSRVNNE
jgi:hypothetical protein